MRKTEINLYEFKGNIIDILEDRPGKLLFTLKDDRHKNLITFMLTASGINEYKNLITIGKSIKVLSKTIGGGVITNPMYVNQIREIF